MDGRRLRLGAAVGLHTLFAVLLMTAVKSSDYKSSTDNLISKYELQRAWLEKMAVYLLGGK